MIVLSVRTLELLQAEVDGAHITKAIGDKSLGISNFSPALQSSLAQDAKMDGTGAIVGDQIASLVAQIVTALKGPKAKVESKPPTPTPAPFVAPVKPVVAPVNPPVAGK